MRTLRWHLRDYQGTNRRSVCDGIRRRCRHPHQQDSVFSPRAGCLSANSIQQSVHENEQPKQLSFFSRDRIHIVQWRLLNPVAQPCESHCFISDGSRVGDGASGRGTSPIALSVQRRCDVGQLLKYCDVWRPGDVWANWFRPSSKVVLLKWRCLIVGGRTFFGRARCAAIEARFVD